MFYLYVLRSLTRPRELYIGSTVNLKVRYKEHNDGKVISTKRYLPWQIIYYEAYQEEKLARIREQKLKHHGNAFKELKKRIFIKGFTQHHTSNSKNKKSLDQHNNSTTKLMPTINGAGFTFIELIIVFTVTMILGSIGIASFVTYSNSQQLRNTSSDIVNMLQSARSGSLSQAHSGDCTAQGQNFVGYQVQLCGKSGTCVQNSSDYELDLVCSTLVEAVQTGKFPTGTGKVTLNVATTRGIFSFLAVSGYTTSGQIVLTGYQNQQKTITITTTGVVREQ